MSNDASCRNKELTFSSVSDQCLWSQTSLWTFRFTEQHQDKPLFFSLKRRREVCCRQQHVLLSSKTRGLMKTVTNMKGGSAAGMLFGLYTESCKPKLFRNINTFTFRTSATCWLTPFLRFQQSQLVFLFLLHFENKYLAFTSVDLPLELSVLTLTKSNGCWRHALMKCWLTLWN